MPEKLQNASQWPRPSTAGRAANPDGILAANERRRPVSGVDPAPATAVRHNQLAWSLNIAAVERARILRGWTRDDLARVARVDAKTTRDMLNGRRHPRLSTIDQVARALECKLEDLITFGPTPSDVSAPE